MSDIGLGTADASVSMSVITSRSRIILIGFVCVSLFLMLELPTLLMSNGQLAKNKLSNK